MAASTIGLSTVVLSITGVASATPTWSAGGSGPTTAVPAGICSVEWDVTGGNGATDVSGSGGGGAGEASATLRVATGDVFTLFPGTSGGVASSSSAGGAGGTNGYTADTTTAGTDGGPDGSGGGGAASVVTKGGALLLLAFGGDGTGPTPGTGGGGRLDQAPTADQTSFDPHAVSGLSGDGTITGTGIPCAPKAPYLNFADGEDGALRLDFVDQSTSAGDVPAAGYEWTRNGGSTWAPLTTTTTDGRIDATVTGLTNGTTYTVAVRAVGGANTVPSPASNAVTGTPIKKAGAPANVQASVSAAAIHITWAPPAGETDIVSYSAWAIPGANPQSNSGQVDCPAMDANARSCTLTVAPGRQYSVGVVADNGNGGNPAYVVTDTVPAPTTVPTGSAAMSSPSGAIGTLAAGQSVTLTGSGYAPSSTVSLYVYSTPVLLGTVVTDAAGAFSTSVTLPSSLAPGSHHLVSAGVDGSGNIRYLVSAVTVATPAGQLAWTGFETLPFLGAAVLAVLAGIGLVVLSRRRRTA